jgi:hypothetical protein
MPTEQPSRILFRLPESYEEEAEKKGVLDGLSDYPIPAERPMLVHRGYWYPPTVITTIKNSNRLIFISSRYVIYPS